MSVLKSNSLNNYFESDLSNTVFDYDRKGGFDLNGQINTLYGQDALANAINIWIQSYKGDFIRNPNRGGYVAPHLMKPMSDTVALAIESGIKDGLLRDFKPSVKVLTLQVTPDYVKRQWKIQMTASSEDLKLVLSIEEILQAKQ